MLTIRYEDGKIRIQTPSRTHHITTLEQVYLVQARLQWYREQSSNEQSAHQYAAALDLLKSAKDQLIRYHEQQCLGSW